MLKTLPVKQIISSLHYLLPRPTLSHSTLTSRNWIMTRCRIDVIARFITTIKCVAIIGLAAPFASVRFRVIGAILFESPTLIHRVETKQTYLSSCTYPLKYLIKEMPAPRTTVLDAIKSRTCVLLCQSLTIRLFRYWIMIGDLFIMNLHNLPIFPPLFPSSIKDRAARKVRARLPEPSHVSSKCNPCRKYHDHPYALCMRWRQ